MRFLYNISITIYGLVIKISSLVYPKSKKWILGRKNILENLQPTDIWIHCASTGEFEQAKPLIEKIKKKNQKIKMLVTFFSPSGYELRKNYNLVNQVCYLPLDTKKNVKKFIHKIKPKKVFFVKYEFWFNYIAELKKQNIKTYFISTVFRKEQYFFKWYGSFFRKSLKGITHFFVQDKNSQQLLKKIKITQTTISGDSRFDQVINNKKRAKNIPLIKKFKGNSPLIICGSTWKKDHKIILSITEYFPKLKWIFIPHELKECHNINQQSKVLMYSDANEKNICSKKILVIDSLGILSHLYKYGDIAYIGGGFGKGIHNILEALVFNCPVIFGPNYKKFNEAIEAIELNIAKSINNKNELKKALKYFLNTTKENNQMQRYCETKSGATSQIYKKTFEPKQN